MIRAMVGRFALAGVIATGLLAGSLAFIPASPASAEEVRQQLNAPMILNMLARPVESPQAAFNAGLRASGDVPRAVRVEDGEVQPDGSVRYGRGTTSMSVTVRNPCPPGDMEHEAAYLRSLPGRPRR